MRLTKVILLSCILFLVSLFWNFSAAAHEPGKEEILKAKVISILAEGEREIGEVKNPYQVVSLKILDGEHKDEVVTFEHGGEVTIQESQKVKQGQIVVLSKLTTDGDPFYMIVDSYRLDNLLYFVFAFFLLVIALSQWKGLGSIVGMVISLLVIIKFIVPQILAGRDPLFVTILGALGIMVTTIYLAHGFSKQTTIALVSTFLCLTLTGILAVFFVKMAKLTGLGTEDAYSLQFGPAANINLKGLLLGGIIIGSLGVLDDITTGLAASVFELHKANPTLKMTSLIRSGFKVGQEHIASLVNTLVLAYAGASLPVFLFFEINPTDLPLWSILNSELIAEEVVRTLAGSIGLLAAVPLTTLLAVWVVKKS